MIVLTMKCSRCSKDVSHDITSERLNEDMIRKFGFCYAHDGRTNVLVCLECEKSYRELKAKLEQCLNKELCSFFKSCGKEKENGDQRECKNV